MAKIDTSKITGYAEMSAEDKLKALEAFEYEDNAAELEKQKAAVSKANSEAAEWKRKHNALLGEDEKKKQEQEEKFANMEKELSELREAKRVSEFKAKFIAQGYDEVLAEDTAKAMADGDSAKVFANQQKFLDEYAKQVKADALKKTPKPAPGAGGGTGEMDYAKKIEEARTNGDFAAVAPNVGQNIPARQSRLIQAPDLLTVRVRSRKLLGSCKHIVHCLRSGQACIVKRFLVIEHDFRVRVQG